MWERFRNEGQLQTGATFQQSQCSGRQCFIWKRIIVLFELRYTPLCRVSGGLIAIIHRTVETLNGVFGSCGPAFLLLRSLVCPPTVIVYVRTPVQEVDRPAISSPPG